MSAVKRNERRGRIVIRNLADHDPKVYPVARNTEFSICRYEVAHTKTFSSRSLLYLMSLCYSIVVVNC